MARVIEVRCEDKDALVNTDFLVTVEDFGEDGVTLWLSAPREDLAEGPSPKDSCTLYGEVRQLISTPGEFASYRDLAKADAKAPASGWQPIETAPKDGVRVDLWEDDGTRWSDCRWDAANVVWEVVLCGRWHPLHRNLTHWMPIPAGPEGGR